MRRDAAMPQPTAALNWRTVRSMAAGGEPKSASIADAP
jgi:hypothetical protein